jgi:hypothetical protein
VDELINDPKLYLKVNFFNFILDVAIYRVDKMFEQVKKHSYIFLCLYEIEKNQKLRTL